MNQATERTAIVTDYSQYLRPTYLYYVYKLPLKRILTHCYIIYSFGKSPLEAFDAHV